MMDIEKNRGEYTLLAYLVCEAASAREVISRAMVGADAFTDGACRAAFLALMQEPSTDETTRLIKLKPILPELVEDANLQSAFMALAVPGNLEYDVLIFAESVIRREGRDAMMALFNQAAGKQMEFLLDEQRRITNEMEARVNAVRAAFPRLASDDSAQDAAADVLDESLLHVPGFVDELVEFSMRTAQRPNRTLSFVGALAMLAHLAGRKFIGPNDSRPNIYLIALAGSGMGKDWPRKLNRKIALEAKIPESVFDVAASGQGLEDAIVRTPALLMQMDEFDTVLNVLKDEKGNKATTEATWRELLTLFTDSGSTATTRRKAASARGGEGGKILYYPSLSIFATAIPSKFYGSLCERALDSGFLARCLVFETGERGEFNPNSGMGKGGLPEAIIRRLREFSARARYCSANEEIDPRDITEVPFAEGAAEEAWKVNKEADAMYDKAKREQDEMSMSVWNRSLELVQKLAMLYAISESIGVKNDFSISPEAVKWAWRLVKPLQLRMLDMVGEHTAANPKDEKLKKVLRLVCKAGKKGIKRKNLLQKSNLDARELDEITRTLLEREDITMEKLAPGRNGVAAVLYIATKRK